MIMTINIAGMELSNQDIHGRMVQNILRNVLSNRDKNLSKRSYFLQKKELCGGMLTVTGQGPLFMGLSSSIPRRELVIHFPSLMLKCPSF